MTLRIEGAVSVGDFVVEADMTVERGETVALVGPNGAGKSTVLRAIAGLHPVDRGSIRFDGRVWDDAEDGTFVTARDRRVGMVFQDYALFPHLTGIENVAFGLRARGADRRSADRAAAEMLDRVGVGSVADRRPGRLSGGQAQRVALARAIVGGPDVVVLDEPLAALDASTRGSVRRELPGWLDAVSADGRRPSRLVVTHDPVDADALADRVVVLEGGRVTQRGTVFELAAAPRTTYVADLMGTNLLHGRLDDGSFHVADGGELVVGAHELADGPAVATIRPAAVSLHRHRPDGSPRNVWTTRISGIGRTHGRVRVTLGPPFPLAVEVTEAGLAGLGADVGDDVWASVKASEIAVVGDA
jgi:molybdate transport system ATP-binding protein